MRCRHPLPDQKTETICPTIIPWWWSLVCTRLEGTLALAAEATTSVRSVWADSGDSPEHCR
jgi:hypothetical protein